MRAFIVSIILVISKVLGQDTEESPKTSPKSPPVFIHPLTNMPDAAIDVKTIYFFPKHTDQKFPIGEVVTVLCHFHNDGQVSYNITAIMGSLNSPYDFNFHIQNYSYKSIGQVIKPGEEFTFDYQFQLHQNLEPVEYALAHTIFYEDDSDSFSTTFFNQTVELYYPNTEYDVETVGQLLFALLSTVSVVLLAVWGCSSDPRALENALKKLIPRLKPSTQSGDDEWTAEHLDGAKGRGAGQQGRAKSARVSADKSD